MFLRCSTRKKNGKEHRYWSIVENKRCVGDRVVQRHVLYLGEINDQQQAAWEKTVEIFEHGQPQPRTVALFPAEGPISVEDPHIVRLKLSELALRRPRQWGACWLAGHLYKELGLDQFWSQRLPVSRKGTRWDLVLQTLCAYRLIDPGSEWRLHRQWFEGSAMGDLLGADFGQLAESHKLYECHDLLLEHKEALFDHLTRRWKDLFNAQFDVLLYDLTSSYFESNPPFPEADKRKFGYSRDKRSDCVQVVIALIVTPEGFPLAYEVMPGNTSDKTTLSGFLEKIEKKYGKAQRIWVMDRGIPTEKVLQEMRQSDPPVLYLVGTPKGRLSQLEAQLTQLPWQEVRAGIEVKLLPQSGEVYVLAQSLDRVNKERSMRRRQLKGLWRRLKELQGMELKRDALLMKLGAARQQAPSAWRLVKIKLARARRRKRKKRPAKARKKRLLLEFSLRKDKLREVRRREGRYLLRTNLTEKPGVELWEFYLQLTHVEEAFKNLKGDLGLRPFYHQKQERIEAHIFVAFLAYCLHVSLGRRLKELAPGLTPRSVLEKFKAMQMLDVHVPTTDGRELILTRYTQPEPDQKLLLEKLKLQLPEQPSPKITTAQVPAK
ncbi:MAG: IS1634 family transposase [Limisphaerales bacterium]